MSFNSQGAFNGTLSGAGTGAAVGSLGGPIGTGIGAAVGGVGGFLVGGLSGLFGGGESDEEKALKKRQELMAREMRDQQQKQSLTRMQGLAQQMLAFNPRNQMLADMAGPQYAFSPQQVAQMGANPMPKEDLPLDMQPTDQGASAFVGGMNDQQLMDYAGRDPKKRQEMEDYIRRKSQRAQADASQQQMLQQGWQQPGPGPAPITLPGAAPARMY